ncbi:hypothetical protein BDR26DRAFT_885406 [Obelidium mucronatum]|nr:hypothetical protein BDR26DRAFT_885406 [Obelidium mucronatum]
MTNESSSDFGDDGDKTLFATDNFATQMQTKPGPSTMETATMQNPMHSIASNASHGDLIQEPEAEKFDWNQPVYFTESDVSKLQSAFASIAQCFESLSRRTEHQEPISKTTIPKHMSISNIPMGKAFMHFLSCFAAASWNRIRQGRNRIFTAEVGYSMTQPHLRGISGRDFFIPTQYRVKSNSPGIQREWIPLDLKNTNGKVSGFGVFKNECVNNPSMGVQTKNVKMVWLALTRDEKRVYNHRAEYLRKRAQE